MKNNLGSIFVLLALFLAQELLATTYTWSLDAYKTSAYENEAIYLKYTCTFSDKAGLYVIEFDPTIQTPEYDIEILSENEKIVDSKKMNVFEFILFVKKAGPFELTLETLMKKTNKDSIENSILGRDNLQYEEYSIEKTRHNVIKIDILKSNSKIVGDLKLSVKKDKPEVEAYEPYHLEFTLEGIADFKEMKDVVYELQGVKIFTQAPTLQMELTQDGERGVWKKSFAFVSQNNFTIPSFSLEYFDLKSKKIKSVSFEELEVKVQKQTLKKEKLLDEITEPFKFKLEYFYYVLTFLAGFILAKINFKREVKVKTQDELFCQKVEDTKTLQELSILLVLEGEIEYNALILEIESEKITSLKKVKKLICKGTR